MWLYHTATISTSDTLPTLPTLRRACFFRMRQK